MGVTFSNLSNYCKNEIALDIDIDIPIPCKKKFQDRNLCAINAPQNDGLLWSVVLCFLMNPETRYDEIHVPSPYAYITSLSKDQVDEMKTWINNTNVFIDSRSCFTKGIQNILKCLKSLILYSVENQSEEIRIWRKDQGLDRPSFFTRIFNRIASCFYNSNTNNTTSRKEMHQIISEYYGKPLHVSVNRTLEAVADILDAQVIIVGETHKPIESYLPYYRTDPKDCFCRLVIFHNEGYKFNKTCYSFGIDEAISTRQQHDAVKKALDVANTFDCKSKFNVTDVPIALELDLAVSLLKHKCFDFVLKLYSQPPYVFKKLSKATIRTTPKSTAFYLAILSDRFDVLFCLYMYALYTPQWWVTSNRRITSSVQKNIGNVVFELRETKRLLSSSNVRDLKKIYNYEKIIEDLTYLTSVISMIASTDQVNKIKLSNKDVKTIETANTMKKIILTIIDAFVNHFNSMKTMSKLYPLDYDNWPRFSDTLTASVFFDYFHILRNVFYMSYTHYEKIESAFYYMLSFDDFQSRNQLRNFGLARIANKEAFLQNLEEFRKILNNQTVTKITLRKKMPIPLDILKSEPVIRDGFILQKLLRYLNITNKLDGTRDEDIFEFAIQRCLVVIGEALKLNTVFSPSDTQSMIISSFPDKITKHFYKIRDSLSHFDEDILQARDNPVQPRLYAGIQQELVKIKHTLSPLIIFQNLHCSSLHYDKMSHWVRQSPKYILATPTGRKILLKNMQFHVVELHNLPILNKLILDRIQNLRTMIVARERLNYEQHKKEKILCLNKLYSHYKEILCLWLSEFMIVNENFNNKNFNARAYNNLLDEIQQTIVSLSGKDNIKTSVTVNLATLDKLKNKIKSSMNLPTTQEMRDKHFDIPNIAKFKNILQRKLTIKQTISGELSSASAPTTGMHPKNGRALHFLVNRIEKMENIIVKRVYGNKPRNFHSDSKTDRQHKILLRSINDHAMLSAFELLVCDCINLLQWATDSKSIWIKADGLYSGIDMRNVLCHVNPALEAANEMLDTYDVANEIVTKVLEFTTDLSAIKHIHELYVSTELDHKRFVKLVQANKRDIYNSLRLNIQSCENWRKYARLIPKN